jgi:putative ABC transport system permease protein
LSDSDDERAAKVVVVNRGVAKKFFDDKSPVGEKISFPDDDPKATLEWFTVVGVVVDVRQAGFDRDPRPEMYFSYPQIVAMGLPSFFSPRDLAVRVKGEPQAYADSVGKAIWSVDPQQPVSNVQPMQQWVDEQIATRDIQLKLFASFAVVSLLHCLQESACMDCWRLR